MAMTMPAMAAPAAGPAAAAAAPGENPLQNIDKFLFLNVAQWALSVRVEVHNIERKISRNAKHLSSTPQLRRRPRRRTLT